jgi:hypothetical protein
MRDEVLAEWLLEENVHRLHVHCHVSGGLVLGRAAWRDRIFRRELPLVLEALAHGDRDLLAANPELGRASVLVHFHAAGEQLDRVEDWGTIGEYG